MSDSANNSLEKFPIKNKSTFYIARHLFLRGMGIVYFFAFLSIYYQAIALWGENGILPAKDYLNAVTDYYGATRYLEQPIIFWFNSSDSFLITCSVVGMIVSCVLVFGFLPAICHLILWWLYLSFIYIGQTFLSFQWDILLVEVGIICILFSPWRLIVHSHKESVSKITLLLLYLILFKVMLQSGLVKLLSEDKTWGNLTALTYHYWTQPIPGPLSWFVHHMPLWIQKTSCFIMFIIEILCPFFIFLGRRMRIVGCLGLVGLQLLIIATGNYSFFNGLMIILCVLLIDDQTFLKMVPKKLYGRLGGEINNREKRRWFYWTKSIVCYCVAIVICLLSVTHIIRMSYGKKAIPKILVKVKDVTDPLILSNSYGLFAVMTTIRPEIIIEGSADGYSWKEYEFKYKPGDIKRMPPQVAPYQPRLDWQMWFAALSGRVERSPWLLSMLEKFARNDQAVLKLIENNPFPDKPPVFLRAKLYHYEFTTPKERKENGNWWNREYKRMFLQPIRLKN